MLIQLDGTGPRYAQIRRALCAQIQGGALAPGTRLPATRELARDLGCSRNIVLLAYEQLLLEGYLVTRPGGGTFVAPGLPEVSEGDRRTAGNTGQAGSAIPPRIVGARSVLSEQGRRIAAIGAEARRVTPRTRWPSIDFMFGMCEPDMRAVGRIRAAFSSVLRARPFGLIDAAGDRGLREQLAERLRGMRGISRSADQILITSGAQQALEICARLFVGEGDRVVVEDPCYEVPPAQFRVAGGEVIPVRVDRQGLDTDALPDDGQPVRLVYVTPSHQFPTGAVMSAARRYALLAWARRTGALIIEDDYDGEFRYEGRPLESLTALEPDGPVIYCGTFAKSLFPSLRLGYLALPPDLMPAAAACKWLTDRGNPSLLQQMVGELMATGEYDRHIRRMQRRYRTRRNILVNAIETHLRGVAEIEGSEAGLHIVVWLPHLDAARTDDLLAACQARDVGVYSVGRYATLPLRRAGLLLGYGLIDDGVIEEGVARLAAAYGEIAGVADPAIASRPPRSLDTPTARSSRRPQGRVSRQPA